MNQAPWSSFRHSANYHRFFDGYTEKKLPVETRKGTREKIVRVYTAEYYTLDISNRKRKLLKALNILLYLIGVFCLFLVYTADPVFNLGFYVGITEFLTVIAMLLLFVAVMSCLISKKYMTIGEYRSGFRVLGRYTLIAAIAYWSNLLSAALYCLLHPAVFSLNSLVYAAAFLIGGLSIFSIYYIWTRTPCKTVENTNTLEGGSMIL